MAKSHLNQCDDNACDGKVGELVEFVEAGGTKPALSSAAPSQTRVCPILG